MTDLIQPISRILLRVLAGIMIGYSLPSDWVYELTNDPFALVTMEAVVGFLVWGAAEAYYWLAHKFGWAK